MKLKRSLLLLWLLLIPYFSNWSLSLPVSYNYWELSPYDSNLEFVVSPRGWFASRSKLDNKTKSQLLYIADDANWRAFMFWDYNWFPYMYVGVWPWQYLGGYIYNQWEITQYRVCDELTWTWSQVSLNNCTTYDTDSSSVDVFSNFNTQSTIDDYVYINLDRSYSSSSAYWQFTYCISSHSIWRSICYDASVCVKHYYYWSCPSVWLNLSGFYNMDSTPHINNFPLEWINWPPDDMDWWSVYWSWDRTNWEVFNAYHEVWYTKQLCYSDFSLDNIVDLSWSIDQFFMTELEDSMYYTWATAFDLYSAYYSWSSLSFDSFMARNITYYNTMISRNFIPTYYFNKSKWLWYLAYKMTIFQDQIEWFNYWDYAKFCNFAINYDSSQSGNVYNWWSVPDSVSTRLEEDYKTRLCADNPSSAFCGAFSAWGGAGWWWATFADAEDLYDSIFSIIEWKKKLNLFGVGDWILPSYIVFWFMAFVLFYMLKK